MLHGLAGEVLARSARGDGRHCVLKVELGGAPAVLKLYGRKRDWLKDALRSLGQRLVVGKTGMAPATRCRVERETLAVWRRHGFDVPAELALPLPAEVPPLRLLLEWLPGELFHVSIHRADGPLADKVRRLERLARESGRRHAVALAEREPRLVQAHATLVHVMVVPALDGGAAPERLVTFDFEVAWARRSSIPRLIGLELMQLLESIAAFAPLDQIAPLIRAFVAAYPERETMVRLAAAIRRGRLPWFAWFNRIGLQLRERGPRRKQAVLHHLEQALAAGER